MAFIFISLFLEEIYEKNYQGQRINFILKDKNIIYNKINYLPIISITSERNGTPPTHVNQPTEGKNTLIIDSFRKGK